jgi:hypothetical protein
MKSARDGILTHGPNSKLRLSKNSLQKMVLYTSIYCSIQSQIVIPATGKPNSTVKSDRVNERQQLQ